MVCGPTCPFELCWCTRHVLCSGNTRIPPTCAWVNAGLLLSFLCVFLRVAVRKCLRFCLCAHHPAVLVIADMLHEPCHRLGGCVVCVCVCVCVHVNICICVSQCMCAFSSFQVASLRKENESLREEVAKQTAGRRERHDFQEINAKLRLQIRDLERLVCDALGCVAATTSVLQSGLPSFLSVSACFSFLYSLCMVFFVCVLLLRPFVFYSLRRYVLEMISSVCHRRMFCFFMYPSPCLFPLSKNHECALGIALWECYLVCVCVCLLPVRAYSVCVCVCASAPCVYESAMQYSRCCVETISGVCFLCECLIVSQVSCSRVRISLFLPACRWLVHECVSHRMLLHSSWCHLGGGRLRCVQ